MQSDGKALGRHLANEHGLSVDQYVVQELYGGVQPTCLVVGCKQVPRRVGFNFKSFCADHTKEAAKAGGQKGGRAPAWNKGKTKQEDPRIAALAERSKGAGNPFYGRKHSEEARAAMSGVNRVQPDDLEARIRTRAVLSSDPQPLSSGKDFILLTPLKDYSHRQQQYLIFECITCGERCSKTLQAFERGSVCPTCSPNNSSIGEQEVADAVDRMIEEAELHYDVVRNDRQALNGLELDVYIPQRRFAVEYHGLYWHSDAAGRDRQTHRRKLEACRAAGITLLQIFADQWRDRQDICLSMIRHRLGLSERVHGRECEVREVDVHTANNFLQKNHLSGEVRARQAFGLFYEDSMVGALTLRFPFTVKHRKANLMEVARFSLERNLAVPGGLGKLIKAVSKWCQQEGFGGLLSYVDLCHGEGSGYEQAGMTRVGETEVSFWYTDGNRRYDRFKFRAQHGLSEELFAASKGVYRIYGCGNAVLVKCF